MRILSGGLPEAESNAMGRSMKSSEPLRLQAMDVTIAGEELQENLTINRAKAHTIPTHNARSTRVYSVSFPVWRV
jgi:hypothetical protein